MSKKIIKELKNLIKKIEESKEIDSSYTNSFTSLGYLFKGRTLGRQRSIDIIQKRIEELTK